jgi:hypothetical protein
MKIFIFLVLLLSYVKANWESELNDMIKLSYVRGPVLKIIILIIDYVKEIRAMQKVETNYQDFIVLV